MNRRLLLGWVLVAPLALGTGPAFAQKASAPGVTDKEIILGTTAPLSGPASAFGSFSRAMLAVFQSLNDQGGINGRKINLTVLDNAYSAPKALEQVRKLVEDVGVFAEVGTVGTVPNVATQRYMNDKKVPQLFVSAGGRRFNDPKTYPWTIPFYPNFELEGSVAAKYVLKAVPDAKIALLYQNDDLGRDYAKGFKAGLGAKTSQIIVETTYDLGDATIDSQIVKVKSAGADVLVEQSTPKFAAQSIRKIQELGWSPLHVIGSVASSIDGVLRPAGLEASKGVVTTQFLKQPTDPAWANDPEVRQFKEIMKKYDPNDNIADYFALTGYMNAYGIVLALKMCGDELTRENVMKQAASLKDARVPMLLPGIVLNTSSTDYAPFKTLRMAKFDGSNWVLVSDALAGE